jgi:(p)ppGpp synthase/HD superfamily hydrolase
MPRRKEFIIGKCFTFRGWWGAFLPFRRGFINGYLILPIRFQSGDLFNTFLNNLPGIGQMSSSPIEQDISLDRIIETYRNNHPGNSYGEEIIASAYQMAAEEYGDTRFADGEKYMQHAATTAYFVSLLGGEHLVIILSLLHKVGIERLKYVLSSDPEVLDEQSRQYLYQAIFKLQTVNLPYLGNGIDVFGSSDTMQNYLKFIEQLTGGDYRVLLHICCDRAVRGATQEEKRIISRTLFEVYAPLMERFNRIFLLPTRYRLPI